MSDLEDVDHEPDDVPLEEELPTSGNHQAEGSFTPPKSGGGGFLKIVAVLVLLGGGGAYFFMSSHRAGSPRQMAESSAIPPLPAARRHQDAADKMPLPVTAPLPASALERGAPEAVPPKNTNAAEPPKNEKIGASDPLAWGGSVAVAAAPPAAIPAPAISAPAAIPAPAGQAVPVIPPAPPPIVNEMPPPATQLTNAGGVASSVLPTMPAVPSASEATAAAPFAAPSAPSSPFTPEAMPVPVQTQAVKTPESQSGGPMPLIPVPVVDKAPALGKAAPPSAAPAAQAAKVEELEKKIADLEKTISQLQQAAVDKENAGEKSAEEENAAPAPIKVHHISHRKAGRTAVAGHAAAVHWVLKAAKPGVAWVARKGSDDLHMVEPGDSLTGIGKVTSIVRSSSGYWMVNGTKGRISQ
jgi:hypothetical protein